MNVFELMGIIAINNTEANNRIDETNNRAGILARGFKSVGRVAGTMGKAVVAGVGVGAAAMGALIKSSIGAFAEYEQLKGGVETLFKDSSGAVLKYADQAYKTAGMSANDYMSTVTGFSASLLQSLGGDTEAAAALSDRAVRDMADNANKMGTSMGSIQDAYQGFAKQNYTMLDNLKLGYGGTKTEMQRLLKDAQKIKKAQGENVEYSINSFADIVEAIGVVQDQMGITGTTAQEASETIAGSFSSAASAWQNLLVGIADGNQDLGQLVTNFVESGKTAAKNITKVLPSLVEGVRGLINGIAPELPGIIQAIFPALLEGAIALVGALASSLPGMLSALGEAIKSVWVGSVWPAIQGSFKAQFGIELPDWTVVEAEISTLWNNIKNGIMSFFKVTFSILTPNEDGTSTAQEIIAWGKKVLAAIGNFFSAVFSIFTEDDDGRTVSERLMNWWDKVATAYGDYISAIFQVFTPDKDGKSVAEEILAWSVKMLDLLGDAIGTVFGIKLPKASDIINSVKNWWQNEVLPFLGLSAPASVTMHTSSSGQTHGGGVGKSFGSNVSMNTYGGGGGGAGVNKVTSHAKGAIFSRSTIFDTRLGLQEVGEAGPEAVAPISVLRQYVREEVAAVNNENARQMQGMREDFRQFMGELPDMLAASFASMKFDVNNREFARLVKAVT